MQDIAQSSVPNEPSAEAASGSRADELHAVTDRSPVVYPSAPERLAGDAGFDPAGGTISNSECYTCFQPLHGAYKFCYTCAAQKFGDDQ